MESSLLTTLIVFGGAVTMLLLLVAVFSAPANTAKGRVHTIAMRRSELRDNKLLRENEKGNKRLITDDMLAKFVAKTFADKDEQMTQYQTKLTMAGIRERSAVNRHVFYKMMWLALGGIIAAALLFVILKPTMSLPMKGVLVLLGAFLGYKMPDFQLNSRINQRTMPIRRSFPDALDMMVVCAESGLGLDAALKKVSQEIQISCPELSEELALTVVELSFFEDRKEALNNLSKRIDIPSVKAFTNTLAQTEKYGTPIAQTLRVLSSEFRNERMMTAETKAAQLPAKLTFPIMICILVPLLVILITPAIIQASASFAGANM